MDIKLGWKPPPLTIIMMTFQIIVFVKVNVISILKAFILVIDPGVGVLKVWSKTKEPKKLNTSLREGSKKMQKCGI